MKKILCYIDMMDRTGAQRVMKNIITNLYQKNYEVILVNDFEIKESNKTYDIPSGIQRFYLREKLEGNVISKNIARIINLRKIIKKNKPDTILSFLGRPNIRMLISTMGLKVKKVVSVRNDPNYEYGKSKIKKEFVNFLFKKANGVVFQTEDAKKYFCQKVQNKSTIILNPISSEFYVFPRPECQKNIVTFGRLEKQKNHFLLLDAYAKAKTAQNDLDDLYIYGDGEMKRTLLEYAIKLNISEFVHFPGNVSNVKEIMLHSKMFVLSSNYEGLPNALMEAMACGTPCISTNCPCGGPKILIENDMQGLLVDCNNSQQLADGIIKFFEDDVLRKQISAHSYQRAQSFNENKIMEEWEKYLLSI